MIASFSLESNALPYTVTLSSAMAVGEITQREYNGAQRVAVLEDSAKKPIYEATWADVEEGDVVLLAVGAKIVKASVVFCTVETEIVTVLLNCGSEWGETHEPEEEVYVRSRL